MKLSFSPEVEAFRREFLGWLEANRPSAAEMAALADFLVSLRPPGQPPAREAHKQPPRK